LNNRIIHFELESILVADPFKRPSLYDVYFKVCQIRGVECHMKPTSRIHKSHDDLPSSIQMLSVESIPQQPVLFKQRPKSMDMSSLLTSLAAPETISTDNNTSIGIEPSSNSPHNIRRGRPPPRSSNSNSNMSLNLSGPSQQNLISSNQTSASSSDIPSATSHNHARSESTPNDPFMAVAKESSISRYQSIQNLKNSVTNLESIPSVKPSNDPFSLSTSGTHTRRPPPPSGSSIRPKSEAWALPSSSSSSSLTFEESVFSSLNSIPITSSSLSQQTHTPLVSTQVQPESVIRKEKPLPPPPPPSKRISTSTAGVSTSSQSPTTPSTSSRMPVQPPPPPPSSWDGQNASPQQVGFSAQGGSVSSVPPVKPARRPPPPPPPSRKREGSLVKNADAASPGDDPFLSVGNKKSFV
jgi:hypothetical protein